MLLSLLCLLLIHTRFVWTGKKDCCQHYGGNTEQRGGKKGCDAVKEGLRLSDIYLYLVMVYFYDV